VNKSAVKIAGAAGLLFLLLTAVTYTVRGMADAWTWTPLALGLGLGAWWLAVYRQHALAVLRERRLRHGANSAIYSLLVLAILALLQAFVVNHDATADLTKDKAHTLSDEMVKTVKNLDQNVQVRAFYGADNRQAFEELLQRVKRVNPGHFDFEFVNPNAKPLLAKELGVRSFGTTVVQSGDKRETINSAKEEDLLNAVLKVSSGGKKTVYLLTGHQERSLNDTQITGASELRKSLDNATFVTQELNLVLKPEVPADAAVVLIVGPRMDLGAPELAGLSRYLGRGGRVFAAMDPRQNTPGLTAWLAKAGVNLGNDIVIELNPYNQVLGLGPDTPLVQTYDAGHPATRDLAAQGGASILMVARTATLGKLPEGATGTVLAKSLPTAFAWRGSGNNAPPKPGPGDLKGPVDLMVAVDAPVKAFGGDAKAPAELRARLVVLGNSEALANRLLPVPNFNNQSLVLNSVRWLADEEKRIALAPKNSENSPLVLDRARASLIRWSFFLLLLATLGAGIAVLRARRRALA
jgi:hypothetical protein